jgi:hypothetical protein
MIMLSVAETVQGDWAEAVRVMVALLMEVLRGCGR